MRPRQKWVGIIVILVVLLIVSSGAGRAWGGGHGFGGHGFHPGFHHFGGFHRFGGPRIGIGIRPFWGPYWGAYPTLTRIRRWLWLPLPYTPHPYPTRREDKPLERGLIRFKTQLPTGAAQHSLPVRRCLVVLWVALSTCWGLCDVTYSSHEHLSPNRPLEESSLPCREHQLWCLAV